MKKIVSILAATAMAASVFAVDFTAGFQLSADFFNYNGGDKSISAMKLKRDNSKDNKPFIFSTNGDNAGATLKFYDAASSGSMEANYWNIWFKPFDVLKIELGAQDIKLNCETVTYWKGKTLGNAEAGMGYKAAFESNGFTLAAALLPGNDKYWMTKADKGDATFAETAFFAQYAADFGTIKVLFDASNNFDDYAIGAGYNNTFGAVSLFADFTFGNNKVSFQDAGDNGKGKLIAADLDAKFSQDGFSAEGYAGFLMNLDNKKDNMNVPMYAKLSYGLDAGTPFLKFEDNNLLAKDFISIITLGFDGNIGACSYELAAEIKTLADGKVGFAMPSWFRFSF